MRQPSGQRRNYFSSCFAPKVHASSIFTGFVIGWKHSLQLRNNLILHLNKHISRNLLRKNAYRKIRRPGVACIHKINLALLVTSLTY